LYQREGESSSEYVKRIKRLDWRTLLASLREFVEMIVALHSAEAMHSVTGVAYAALRVDVARN
jgi:hypothetical protein